MLGRLRQRILQESRDTQNLRRESRVQIPLAQIPLAQIPLVQIPLAQISLGSKIQAARDTKMHVGQALDAHQNNQ